MLGNLIAPTAEALGASLGLRRSLCAASRYARSTCRACLAACPLDALRREGDRWSAGPSCDGCGACAAACPTGALDVRAPSRHDIESALRDVLDRSPDEEIVFVCEQWRPPEAASKPSIGALSIPCAARLDETLLVPPLLQGTARVVIRTGDCARCDRLPQLGRVFGHTLRAARTVLRACGVNEKRLACGRAEQAALTSPVAGASLGMERRELFRRLLRTAASPPPDSPTGLPDAGTPRRRRLVDAIRSHGRVEPVPATPDLPVGRVEISSDCFGCNVCAHVCVNGALAREETAAGRVTLRFDAALCDVCGACAEACMPGAVRLTAAPDLGVLAPRPPETLFVLERRDCVLCGIPFHSAEPDLCPRCRRFAGNGRGPRTPAAAETAAGGA